MTKYSKGAGDKVERALHEEKEGTLKSGRSGKTVTSRKQAIAIGMSEARKQGAKVPEAPETKGTSKKAAAKKVASKKAVKAASKKAAPKKATKSEKKAPAKAAPKKATTKT